MKYLFIVQGEGLGHTTQSIALRSILEKNGHKVSTTFLGSNFFRKENELYRSIPHECFYSPFFLHRSDKKGINLFLTFLYNLFLAPIYLFTILRIAYRIRTSDVNAIIVFYDMIGQLGSFLSFSAKPVFSVSHHFIFEQPSFIWPSHRKAERIMLKIHSWLASLGAKKKLALSFTPESNIPTKRLYFVPPLLRHEILDSIPVEGDHIHIYCLQPGFLDSIINLAKRMPEKEFRVFLHEIKNEPQLPSNVNIYFISEVKFRKSMTTASLIICTSGFETPAEAIYLNKPLIVVPSKGHFEQYCNALDVLRIKAAVVWDSFNIDIDPVLKDNPAHDNFVKWISMSEEILLKHLSE